MAVTFPYGIERADADKNRFVQAISKVGVHDESSGTDQVFDVGQLRLRFTVAQEGREAVQVRFDPWTATFKGPGWSFTWTELMFRPENCLARIVSP